MGLRNIYVLFFLLVSSTSQAQFDGVEIAVSKNFRMLIPGLGFDPGGNGVSLRTNVNFHLNKDLIAGVGAETGANGIGNYVSSAFGLHHLFDLPGNKFALSSGLTTQHGIGLFHPAGYYIFGFSEVNSLRYSLQNGNWMAFFLEFRFYSCPGYTIVSEVNSFLDLQVGLQYSFR